MLNNQENLYSGAGFILLSPDLSHTLLVKGKKSPKWGFPKGHREEEDANVIETAIRELYEETGLVRDDIIIHEKSFSLLKDGTGHIFSYAVLKKDTSLGKAGPKNEIITTMWIPIEDLLLMNIYSNKYLNFWICDMKNDTSHISVNIFRQLLINLTLDERYN
jgi:8-oxo-dGTP pyrophosphatase MutT (NUDIX family)